MLITLAFSPLVMAAEVLYTFTNAPLTAGRVSGHAIRLVSTDASRLIKGLPVTVALPSGKTVLGTVTRDTGSHALLPGRFTTTASRTIAVAFENGAGSAELHVQNNLIVGITLLDTSSNTFYQTDTDDNGNGLLTEEDVDGFICYEMPLDPGTNRNRQRSLVTTGMAPDLSLLENLESNPNASKVIYINFWGGIIEDTVWNVNYNGGTPINYTPYSGDADTSTFSDNDRYTMWLAWNEVAEDYSSFDVNITTRQSVYENSSITNRSQIIATKTNYFYPGVGGAAFLNSFGGLSEYYTTGWTWNSQEGSLGMTISHEAGHQMGLSHDGTFSQAYYTGHGNWGPIMGAPFNQPYVQWSKGEYPNASNNQNDFFTINQKLATLADDAGDSIASATILENVQDITRIITPDGISPDIDVYKFTLTTAQSIKLRVLPLLGYEQEQRAANITLNIKLEDSIGVVHSVKSIDYLPPSPDTNIFFLDTSLPADTYYLHVDAVSPDDNWFSGFGEYGNGGRYRLTLEVDPAVVTPIPETVLLGSSEEFTWTALGTAVADYWLYAGTSIGSRNLYDSGSLGAATSETIDRLPTNGITVYVRLWWRIAGSGWEFADYSYNAVTETLVDPFVSAPEQQSTLSASTETFVWSDGSSAADYWIYIGSSIGALNVYNSGNLGSATNVTVSSLPTGGGRLFLRFWWRLPGDAWQFKDYSYTAALIADADPSITLPVVGSILSDSNETFEWVYNGTDGVTYWLYFGSSVGGYDIDNSGNLGSSTAYSPDNLPSDGSQLYLRLWWKIAGKPWDYTDYSYFAAAP